MRKRSITVFLSVYAALCIAYGVGSSVIMPDNSDIISAVEQTSFVESSASSNTKKADESESSVESAESSVNELIVSDQAESSAEPEPSFIESNETEQSETQIEEDNGDEYTETKPSLEEFLKSLRCSGCRHNCTLFSPRCMNGARKASQAENQYYQMYGE